MEKNPELIYNRYSMNNLKQLQGLDELIALNKAIDSIYYKDYSSERNQNLTEHIMKAIKLIDSNLQTPNSLSKQELSFLYYSKSMLLDKLPEYSKTAEESASKSVSSLT